MRLETKLFNVRLPLDLLKQLSEVKKNKGVSKSFQVTEALRKYFTK